MNLIPSDRARITTLALRYLAERLGLARTDAELRLEYETLTIEALKPEIIDYLAEIQFELMRRSYLATGIKNIDITFLDQLILSFDVDCESFDTSAENMIATLDLPVVVETAPAQIDLPMGDVQQVSEPEELCTIDQIIAHVSRRTNQSAEALRNTIESMNVQRFKLRGEIYVSSKIVGQIISRWAQTLAADVQMGLHYDEIKPEPIKSVPAKTATAKTGTKRTPAKKKTTAAPKRTPKPAAEAAE